MKLTPEQRKTIEDAFNAYPEGYVSNYKYSTMKGIEEQLENPNEKDGKRMVYYISNVKLDEKLNAHHLSVNKVEEET
jgi:hypothetical protein